MKLSVSILTCIAFTLFSNFSFGQDFIYGKVIDEEGSPLFDVEVFWEANNDLDRAKQRTTNDGTFKIKIAKDSTQVLGIKYPGKKEVRKRITDAEHNEFILIELKEKGVTSITASRWEQNVNEIPASVVVISREEIAQNGYMTLQEIIENVPGLFTLDHRTENGITIGVRGFWSDVNRNVMIQVNGVNMLSERWMDFGFDKINVAVEAIDKIEIVRGPMNVIYGSGAFFGVINVITNDNQNQNSGIVATGFGFQSQNNGNPFSKFGPSGIKKNFFRYSGGNSEFNFSLNAMTYQRGGFQELWDDMVLDTTYEEDAENTSFPGYPNSITISKYKGDTIHPRRYSKYHQALNLSVSYNGFFADVNYASSNQGVSFYSQPGPGDRNDYRSYTGNFQFGYRGSANGDRFNYQAKVAYMKSNTVGEMKYYSDDAFSYGEDRVSTIRAEFNTRTNLSEMISNKSNFQVDLLAGLYFSRNFENNSFYNLPGFVLNNWLTGVLPGSSVDTKAAYIQTEVKFKNWIVVSGIRAEYLGSYEIINSTNAGTDDYNPVIDTVKADRIPTFSPRLAVIYKKASKKKGVNHYFKAMFGVASNEPNAPKNAGDIMRYNNANNKNEPYLDAEKITTYELGYTFVNELVEMEFNGNLFFNDLNSLIVTESIVLDGGGFDGHSKNSGKLSTFGLELIAKKRFKILLNKSKSIGLNTSLSGTFQKTENQSAQVSDPRTVSFSPAALGTANIIGTYNNFSIGIGANYVGKMESYYFESFTDGNNINQGYYLGESTSGYTRISLNFRQDNIRFFNDPSGGFYYNFKISNLLNKQYHYPTYSTVSWAKKGILGRGRQFLLSIGYNF